VKRFPLAWTSLVIACAWLSLAVNARADLPHFWRVASPDHEQTFAYGSEQSRVWKEWGPDRHLVVLLNFTNDPYVDQNNPRRYDNFSFSFPGITLGKDGRTFFYHAPDGRRIAVAAKRPDFLGINEIHLLPNAALEIDKPHGYLSLTLIIADRAETASLP
jgi:hypothetical protein